MNCNNCRYELSQCLDGRLPSGRRTIVMQHTASCEACAIFWDEFQAAQQLTLRLPREQVGESFRDQLWQRIRVGEGTPEAVFREPVPTLLKVRYALTGAAAAAAVLLVGLWIQDDLDTNGTNPSAEEMAVVSREQPRVRTHLAPTVVQDSTVGTGQLLNVTPQPFTSNLYAVETARQFEVRYASVDCGLRQLDMQQGQVLDVQSIEVIVERILTDASEMRVFAEVLLEMRERKHVSFPDSEIGADLRIVTSMLVPKQLQDQSIRTVNTFVAPVVRENRRLQRLSYYIHLTPTLDPHEDAATLIQLNIRRPEVFKKLFIRLGQGEGGQEFGLFGHKLLFQLEDGCGTFFVAPRSRISRR